MSSNSGVRESRALSLTRFSIAIFDRWENKKQKTKNERERFWWTIWKQGCALETKIYEKNKELYNSNKNMAGEQSKSGWLWKSGGKKRTKPGHWQKRWFMLQGGVLAYAKKKGAKPAGYIDIDHVSQFQSQGEDTGKQFFNLVTARRTFFLYSIEAGERETWISAIKNNIFFHYAKDPAVVEIPLDR
jgi:PH domain